MQLDLNDEETLGLLNLLTETIENDRYPLSPRIRTLRGILAKFGPMAPTPTPPAAEPGGARPAAGAPTEVEFGRDTHHLLSLAKRQNGILQRAHVGIAQSGGRVVEAAMLPGER